MSARAVEQLIGCAKLSSTFAYFCAQPAAEAATMPQANSASRTCGVMRYPLNQSRSGLTVAPALTSPSRTAATILSAPGLSPWMQMVSTLAAMVLPVLARDQLAVVGVDAIREALGGDAHLGLARFGVVLRHGHDYEDQVRVE